MDPGSCACQRVAAALIVGAPRKDRPEIEQMLRKHHADGARLQQGQIGGHDEGRAEQVFI